MALELNKLTHAVDDLGADAAQRLRDLENRLPVARAMLNAIGQADTAVREKIEAALKFRWAGAIPTAEPVHAALPLPPYPARVNVIAADGSQIYPDRHGVALYYLINTGSIVFRHGSSEAPGTHAQPQVFYKDDDLYEDEGNLILSAKIDAQRDIRELGELARLAVVEAPLAPTVAFLDNGLLLYYSLQATDPDEIRRVIGEYLGHLTSVRKSGAAVAGIVDRPRAASVVRLLHLAGLDLDEIREDQLRSLGPFQHMTDSLLFSFLRPGERSALFENASPVNQDRYKPEGHSIFLFYLNAGRPGRDALLRVEVPEWVARDPTRLDLAHAAIVEQSRVGDGFPYLLIRAHELAVVSVNERREFDQMVTGALMRCGLRPGISQKAQGKAWTGAAKRRYPR